MPRGPGSGAFRAFGLRLGFGVRAARPVLMRRFGDRSRGIFMRTPAGMRTRSRKRRARTRGPAMATGAPRRGPHGPAALLRKANSQNLPPPGHPQMTGPTPSRHASTISGVVGSRLSVSPYSDSAPRGSRMAPRPCILTPSTRVPHLLLRVGCMSRSALLTCSPWSTVASPLRPSFS